MPERGNEHKSKSVIFPQQIQATSLYPGILQRGRQIEKTLGTLGCPALVLVTRSCYCLCLPAGFTESQGMNMNRHMEESLPTASEFRGQASVGSSKKMLLHGKLGTNCFLPQGLSQCPY